MRIEQELDGTRRPRDTLVCAWLAAAAVGVAAPLAARWFGIGLVDDAFISLRYAQHWSDGHGLCFNPGERVEGFTNFLLVALQALAIRVRLDPVASMSFLGWASLALLSGLTAGLVRGAIASQGRAVSVLIGVLVAASPMMIAWAASGMETALYSTLLLAAIAASMNATTESSAGGMGLLLALLGMARPEGIAFLPIVLVAAWRATRAPRIIASLLATFVLVFGGYFSARWAYFGLPFPNTFYAKLDFGNTALAARGAGYLLDFVLALPQVVVLAAVAAATRRRRPRWVIPFAATVLLQFALVVYEGGDHFPLFRFLAPTWPFLAILAWEGCFRIAGVLTSRVARARVAFALWGMVVLSSYVTVATRQRREESVGAGHLERFRQESQLTEVRSFLGRWLHLNVPPDSTLCVAPIGAIGYHSGLRILDVHGIVNAHVAHRRMALGTGYAGHEKFDVEQIFASKPDRILLFVCLTRRPLRPDEQANLLWSEADHVLHADPRLESDYRLESYDTGEGYLNIYVRRRP